MPLSYKHHHPKRELSGDASVNKNERRAQETVYEVVYKTASKTFEGEIGGYVTVGPGEEMPTALANADPVETAAVGDPIQGDKDDSASSLTEIRAPTESTSLGSVLAKATGEASPSMDINDQLSTSLSPPVASSTQDTSADKGSDGGTSAGAKAGIALGVFGGVFLVGMIVWLIFNRRKKNAQQERLDDEKMNGASAPAGGSDHLHAMPTNAPRISLRPVTQFFPNWNLDKRTSKGAAMALGPASAAQRGPGNGWNRPGTSQSNHPNNPFGNSAERIEGDDRAGHNAQMSRSQDPFTANGPAVAAGAAAGAAGLSRKTSMRHDGDRGMDLTLASNNLGAVPPSPSGTEFSASLMPAGSAPPPSQGAAAIAAAGGPASTTVHRVQLDFKPTLEDEMELKAGDLVRLLHEYDDGWTLCIRLDRSQQGVVPRTCLSARPVKPRPPPGGQRPGPPVNPQNGQARGPNNPQGRPMTPQGRPMTPQGHPGPGPRPQSPGPRFQGPPGPGGPGRPMSPGINGRGPRPQSPGPRFQGPPGPGGPGRPMSPGPGRPMSPGPNGHGPRPQSPGPRFQGPPGGRPQSPNGMNPRQQMSPPGPSAMHPQPPTNKPVERKPVPGQAY